MRVFVQRENQRNRLVLLWGSGLVGGAIAKYLTLSGAIRSHDVPSKWGLSPDAFAAHWPAIQAPLAALAARESPAVVQLCWAAGQAGFLASSTDMEAENRDFERYAKGARATAEHIGVPLEIYLVSSAGGLFEGTGFVHADSTPTPLRPYGLGKVRLEESAKQCSVATRAYRLSTVYGPSSGPRRGLIATLVDNTLQGRVTRIFGSPLTLRDYVHCFDVGRFVVSDMSRSTAIRNDAVVLASGRPSTILEVKGLVEKAMRRRAIATFDPVRSNARDIVFAKDATPPSFEAVDLYTGLRLR